MSTSHDTSEGEAAVVTVDGPEPLIDIGALAERLGVTERFVRRLVEERRVSYHKIGKFVRFDPNEISDWIANTRIEKRRGD